MVFTAVKRLFIQRRELNISMRIRIDQPLSPKAAYALLCFAFTVNTKNKGPQHFFTMLRPFFHISILKRITSGVKLIQLDEGSVVASIAKIREDMKDDEETSDEQSEEAGMTEEVLETDSEDNSEENETE